MSRTRPHLVDRMLQAKISLSDDLGEEWYPAAVARETELHRGSVDGGTARNRVARSQATALCARWRRSLAVAEDFVVTRDIGAVIIQAGEELPDDYIARHHHLFAEHGLVWFEEPLADEIQSAPIQMLTWHHGTGHSDRAGGTVAGLEINLWAVMGPHLVPIGSDFLPYGLPSLGWVTLPISEDLAHKVPQEVLDRKISSATRFVLAMQMFMRDELPAVTRWDPPRSQMRHVRRLDFHSPKINVIELRRRAYHSTGEQGERNALSVRFIVRGHWHRYHVGPTHPLHSGLTDEKELVHMYLLPYCKGPEDAPLVPSPTRVHVLSR